MIMETKNKSASDLKFASTLSLAVGIILLGLKFYAYHITHSQAIFSDALESIVNVSAALVTLIVIVLATRPADKDHPFGHGKIEIMASTFEGGAILTAGILVILQSIEAFHKGNTIEEIDLGILIVIVAGAINGILGWGLYQRGKKLYSEALKSSGMHLMSDTLTSFGLFAGLLLVKYTGIQWIDPVIAAIFGFILALTGIKIILRSGNILIDGHDVETLKLLTNLFDKHRVPGIIQIHFTRVLRSGNYHHIDCHMTVPEFWTVLESHDACKKFETNVLAEYPVQGEFHIHLDPCRRNFCVHCDLKDCPIRQKEFSDRLSLKFDEVVSPTKGY